MTFFSAFTVIFGSMLALMAVIAAWLFRTSSAPLAPKLAVPALLVGLACAAPFAIRSMMGLPVPASFKALPDRAQLVAFVPHDDSGLVDLWLRNGDIPRAYETRLDERMKKTLRAAQDAMEHGRPAMLAKRKFEARARKSQTGGLTNIVVDDQSEYVLDDSVRSALPAKE